MWFLYRAIVRRIVRNGFRRLSETRSATHIVAQFASDGVFSFATDGTLGGERRGRGRIAAWFDEIFALFPDLTIEPLAIVVEGWPWATSVATRLAIRATLPDGTPYENEGMQFVRLRFGKILEDRIYEDTGRLERALVTIRSVRAASTTPPA